MRQVDEDERKNFQLQTPVAVGYHECDSPQCSETARRSRTSGPKDARLKSDPPKMRIQDLAFLRVPAIRGMMEVALGVSDVADVKLPRMVPTRQTLRRNGVNHKMSTALQLNEEHVAPAKVNRRGDSWGTLL